MWDSNRMTPEPHEVEDTPPAPPLPPLRAPVGARLTPDADDARFIRRTLILVVIAAVLLALWRASDLLILAFGSVLGATVIHALRPLMLHRARALSGRGPDPQPLHSERSSRQGYAHA